MLPFGNNTVIATLHHSCSWLGVYTRLHLSTVSQGWRGDSWDPPHHAELMNIYIYLEMRGHLLVSPPAFNKQFQTYSHIDTRSQN